MASLLVTFMITSQPVASPEIESARRNFVLERMN
jgi:hypothetical protein